MRTTNQQHDLLLPRPCWRRGSLANHWGVSDRTVDRMVKDGRLGKPRFLGTRTPIWSDEQRIEAERSLTDVVQITHVAKDRPAKGGGK
jgi:hypothetical protein